MIRYRTTWVLVCQIVMLLGLGLFACRPAEKGKSDLSAFYFQPDDFPPAGITYIYANKLDSLSPPEVWHFQKIAPGQMESRNFDEQGGLVQQQFDRFVSNGVLTDSLFLFSTDSLGDKQRLRVKVTSPNRFPFDAIDSSKVWLTHLEWYQPGDSLHIVLERRRRYMGPTTWFFQGKSVPAIRFRTEDTFETERDGWTTSTWTGEEIYAFHLGLVHYKREISEAMKLDFELVDRH